MLAETYGLSMTKTFNKSNSIRKMKNPAYQEQISQAKFTRTNSLLHTPPVRKGSEDTTVSAKFYTRMDIIEKL
jgi:hypothetical protein